MWYVSQLAHYLFSNHTIFGRNVSTHPIVHISRCVPVHVCLYYRSARRSATMNVTFSVTVSPDTGFPSFMLPFLSSTEVHSTRIFHQSLYTQTYIQLRSSFKKMYRKIDGRQTSSFIKKVFDFGFFAEEASWIYPISKI